MDRVDLRRHSIALEGGCVILRPLVETDWAILARWNDDPDVLYYSEGDDVQSRPIEDVKGIYCEVSQTGFCFIIEVDGEPIGECWLQEMNFERILARYPDKDCRRIDISIGEKDRWGKGYGTDTIRILTKFGFERENADYIFGCGIADYNPRSRRAFEKAGYTLDRCIKSESPKAKWEYDLVLGREDYLS